MTTLAYMRGYAARQNGDGDGDGPVRFVAATEGAKADGVDLRMDRADLSRYQANPVIGYGHRYGGRDSLPIGRSERTWVDGDRLMMDVRFDDDDEFATQVERKIRDGFLNAMSIGFAFDDVDIEAETVAPESWELVESSIVPIPMDADALVASGGRMRDLHDLLTEAREGKVLSKSNLKLVKDAIAALQALADAASKDDTSEKSAPAATPRLARAKTLV